MTIDRRPALAVLCLTLCSGLAAAADPALPGTARPEPQAARPATQPVTHPRPAPKATPHPRPPARSALPPDVAVGPLDGPDPDAAGLISAARAGFGVDLWRGGDSDRAIDLLDRLQPSPLPGLQDLVFRLLLSEAAPPLRNDDRLLIARIDALVRRGALDQAQALIERAGPASAEIFSRWFDVSLLTGSEDRACAALNANPALDPGVSARVFCLARDGRWDTAVLSLETARALGQMSEPDYALLARFLDPELFEGDPQLPRPGQPTPLAFRIHEAIGEALPTRDLPLAYTWTDLGYSAGWKAQLEAAERLARASAISGNRLLGLYTERRAAASGGLWDRVRAIQALDLALNTGDLAAAGHALDAAAAEMGLAGLEPALASMLAPRLVNLPPDGPGAVEAARLMLLDGKLPPRLPAEGPAGLRLARDLMAGLPPAEPPAGYPAQAIAAAFDGIVVPVTRGQGETVLAALSLLTPGAEADPQDWQDALRMLRAAGQEQSARRIASDLILLGGPEG